MKKSTVWEPPSVMESFGLFVHCVDESTDFLGGKNLMVKCKSNSVVL